MAKKLEEFGISTAPWTAKQGYNAWQVLCDGGHAILVDDEYGEENEGANLDEAEARLIAAAPDLYECLFEALQTVDYAAPVNRAKWRAALAKASGEEVANG